MIKIIRYSMHRVTDLPVKVLSIVLLVLSIAVSVPLTVVTWRSGGGPWGFGIVGLPVLIPLSAYLLFGIAGLAKQEVVQREWFIGAHLITLIAGIAGLFMFPVYPVFVAVIPVLLATVGIIDKRHFKALLLLMISLAIVANIVLLKWEVDFHRALPLLQLFERSGFAEP